MGMFSAGLIEQIARLYEQCGAGADAAVSQLEHALQCATLPTACLATAVSALAHAERAITLRRVAL